jgi:hypothetical protein
MHIRTVFLMGLSACGLLGQVDTGRLLGTIRDASGSTVPGAKVAITNEGTGLRLTMETREDGSYIFTPIRSGSYTVEVEANGFQKARRTGVTVNIQQQSVVDFTLSPGEVTTTVDVTEQLPVLQTQSGSVGETVAARTINNLPLSGRNYTFLARLTAGVTHGQPEGRGLNANGWFAANGTRPAQNNYLLDGIDNNSNNVDFLSGAAYVVRPPVDAINEFKLQTSSFSAEFGRAGGAVLNATLKSGSNNFHGSAWEFLRNDKLDAADFFQNANRQRKGAFRQNQFGVAGGGRLVRDKTFWFADYEGTRISQAIPLSATVPTAAQRASGWTDFSDLIRLQSGTRTDALGRTFPIGTVFDPSSARQVDATRWVREAFPGNLVPRSRLNPNTIKLIELYPSPTAASLVGNYGVNRGATTDVNSFDVRIDHNFSASDQLFGRYSYSDSPRFRPGPFEGVADGGGFNDGNETVRTQGAALSYTHLFSATLINEARIGFNRERVYRVQPFGDDTSNIPSTFGIQGIPQIKGNGGLPGLSIGGLSNLGPTDWLVSERFSNTLQFSENLTKIYKSHTFKGGFEAQKIDFPWTAPPTARGRFSFGGTYTSVPEVGDGSTGRVQFLLSPAMASTPRGNELLGGANSVSASNFGSVSNNKYYLGSYFQDDWKITSKLTLNLGLRWDFFSQVGEKHGAQGNFVPAPPGQAQFLIPARRQGKPELSQSFIDALRTDGIQLVHTDEYGSGLGISQRANFAPRIAFAYQMRAKTVIRGGYGIYYGAFENRGGAPNLGYNYPFQFSFSFPSDNSVSPVRYADGSIGTLERGLLGIPMDTRLVRAPGLAFRGIEFRYKTPYVQSYNFTVQQDLGANTSIDAGYVASLSRHVEAFSGTNHVPLILPPGLNPQNYVPFRTFARGSSYATTNGNAHYHSMQGKVTRRVADGLNFLFAYTWAKTFTNAGDLLNGGGIGGFRAPNVPGWGIKKDMALASFDVRHAAVFSGTYDFPVGKGRRFASGMSGVTNAILGAWSSNWILTLYDGQPQTVGCTRATTSGLGCVALMTGEPLYVGKVEQFYNPGAFRDPAPATTVGQADFGPLGGGRTQVTGPPLRKFDFSIFKSFQVHENKRAEFRLESFNLTNTPSFALPGNLNFADRNNFGRIFATRNNPNDARQIQLALKFYW